MRRSVQPGWQETIAAIATAAGPAAVGIVRLSGPDALAVLRALAEAQLPRLIARRLTRVTIADPESGSAIDDVLAVVFRGPRSYTGEDVVEIHCHGGRGVERVLAAALRAGCRPARPGEFTLRAFLNGRMDLTQAEAVADLIAARTEAAAATALDALRGRLATETASLRSAVLDLLARVEASVDFPEEDEVRSAGPPIWARQAEALARRASALAATYEHGRLLRDGARAVIAGLPNAGKSSLFNALLGRDRAIVHHEPGTTRDYIEETADIGGVPVTLVDTAGLWDAPAGPDSHGVARSSEIIASADLVLLVIDSGAPLSTDLAPVTAAVSGKRLLAVLSKSDLPQRCTGAEYEAVSGSELPGAALCVSAATGAGLDALRAAIRAVFDSSDDETSSLPVVTRQRQHLSLRRCARALDTASRAPEPELASVCLRDSLASLADLAGETTPDDVLGRIFSEFCVGK